MYVFFQTASYPRGSRVLPQSFTSIPQGVPAIKRWVRMIAYQAVARETKDVDRALFATDEFSNGYFHWICDVLPRLEAACNSGDSPTNLPGPCHGDVSVRCAQSGALRLFQRLHLFLERKDTMLRSHGCDSGGAHGQLSAISDEGFERAGFGPTLAQDPRAAGSTSAEPAPLRRRIVE